MYIYIYIYVAKCILKDINSSFAKRDRRQSKHTVCNANAKLGAHVWENIDS